MGCVILDRAKFIPVVTAQEMSRLEKWDIHQGASQEAFMLQAGRRVAEAVMRRAPPQSSILLLIGKGNNGGDGYAAGIELLKKGYPVSAFILYPTNHCTPLNQKMEALFRKTGGQTSDDFTAADLVVDALLGTGFQGPLEPPLQIAISMANWSGKPILSIDIPSGLDSTTGEGPGAIIATETITLGLPKIGFFLRDGWNRVGTLRIESFGLSDEAILQANPVAWIPKLEHLHLPPMERTQHKYQRGFAVGFGGSKEYKGALKLSGLSALHSGAGIVKLFTLEDIGPTANELICQIWNNSAWEESLAKAQSVFIGPGLGRKPEAKQWLQKHLSFIQQPTVIDADALFFLPELKHWPKHTIITPHQGEMAHLLGKPVDHAACQNYVDHHNITLVLKGAPTFLFHKNQLPIIIPRGDPGMATAGSGDVLTGIIAALLAQSKSPFDAALLGIVLHALSGEVAARVKTSYGYSASDLIDFLPDAMRALLK